MNFEAILAGIQAMGEMVGQAQKRNAGEDVPAPISITGKRSESQMAEGGGNDALLKQIQEMRAQIDELGKRLPEQNPQAQQQQQQTETAPFTLESLLDKLREFG